MTRLLNRILGILSSLSFLAPLFTRFVIGSAFFLTGRGKWMNIERVTGFFSDLGIPFPGANAMFIASLEMIGGMLLIAGLGTRLIAALLSCTMIVALMTADREKFVASLGGDMTEVVPLVYFLFLSWLLLFGAGKVSVDEWLGRKLGLGGPRGSS
jgi:putative oxidoreductase